MSSPPPVPAQTVTLRSVLFDQMPLFKRAMVFGLIANLLVLVPTVFMLEVYDRVLNSRSTPTLLALLGITLFAYVVMEAMELLRTELMSRAGQRIDGALRARLFDSAFRLTLARGGLHTQVFNDLRTLREFVASPAVAAMMELPSAVIFLVITFWIHPLLGVLALCGALLQVWITWRTERQTMPALTEANKAAIEAQNYAASTLRSAQVIEAMGMLGAVRERWMRVQRRFLDRQAQASDSGGTNSAIGRLVQTMQSSVLLGAACWLALRPESAAAMSGGMMVISSVFGGRVLSPLVQLIAQWRSVVNVRDAYGRLARLIDGMPVPPPTMPLPAPEGRLTVEAVVAAAPGSQVPILQGVSFAAQPGEVVMVVGPSAAGKSTLARLLAGIWPPASGSVRLDGANVFTWNREELGPYIGYLPQGVELFGGTVAENIARMGPVDREQVQAAGTLAGLDPLVAELPQGYDTPIGEEGAFLSGGQRQRVALARALYGLPRFIVLDEPNSSLDEAGEALLTQTLNTLKAARRTVVVVSHRTSLLPVVDRMLVMAEGRVALFGPRDEVLARLRPPAQPAPVVAPQTAAPPAAPPTAPPGVLPAPGGAA